MSETVSAVPGAHPISRVGSERDFSCRVFHHGEPVPAPVDFGHISEILKEEGCLVWLDVVDPEPKDLALLQREFDLHPLSVEDAIHAHQRPKIESYEAYWFIVVQAATMADTGIDFHEIAIFASRNFLVTVRHDPVYSLEEIERRWSSHPEELRRGGGFLLYTILDTVVDGYLPVSAQFEDRIDDLEEMLFDKRAVYRDLLPEIFGMKKDAQRFRWAVLPMRDILNPIVRRDLDIFPDEVIAYFRDVYDHTIRVIDQLDTVRDLANSVLEIQLSVVANRHNEVSKQLTVIATIFLPLSFIVGFFGQNFQFLVSHIASGSSFWVVGIGSELVAVSLLLVMFKRRGWF